MDYLLGLLPELTLLHISIAIGVLALIIVIVAWRRSRPKFVPAPVEEEDSVAAEDTVYEPGLIELPPSKGVPAELFFWTQQNGVMMAIRTGDHRIAMSFLPNADKVSFHEFVSDMWPQVHECLLEGVKGQDPAASAKVNADPAEPPLENPDKMKKKEGESQGDFLRRKNDMRQRWKAQNGKAAA